MRKRAQLQRHQDSRIASSSRREPDSSPRLMMWNRVLLAWLVLPVVAQTEGSRDVLCVYPLSGVYAPLQRILFYLLLSFGVIGRRQRWLVAGALASAMTYCGAAAIHSVLLLAKARSPVVDLDVYGVFAATSTGIMLTTPLLAWSTTLQTVEREVRILITLWTLLILVGAILAIATIYIRGETKGPSCYDSLSTVDIPYTASALHNITASCTYVCFPEESPLGRSPGDVLAWENKLSRPFDIISVFLPTIAASIPAAFIAWTQYVFRSGHSYLIRPPPFFSRLELGWLGEVLFEKRRDSNLNHNPSSARTPSVPSPGQGSGRFPWLAVAYQYYFVLGSFGVFVVNLVMNEVRFRELPVGEMMYEVDQWTSWVGVALILLAQVISRFLKRSKRHTSQTVGDREELPWDQERGENAYRKMGIRTDTFRSEVSTFRRRNSL